jgi:hypothetical protein
MDGETDAEGWTGIDGRMDGDTPLTTPRRAIGPCYTTGQDRAWANHIVLPANHIGLGGEAGVCEGGDRGVGGARRRRLALHRWPIHRKLVFLHTAQVGRKTAACAIMCQKEQNVENVQNCTKCATVRKKRQKGVKGQKGAKLRAIEQNEPNCKTWHKNAQKCAKCAERGSTSWKTSRRLTS